MKLFKSLIIDMAFLATALTLASISAHTMTVELDFIVLFIVFFGLKIIVSVLEYIEKETW